MKAGHSYVIAGETRICNRTENEHGTYVLLDRACPYCYEEMREIDGNIAWGWWSRECVE